MEKQVDAIYHVCLHKQLSSDMCVSHNLSCQTQLVSLTHAKVP